MRALALPLFFATSLALLLGGCALTPEQQAYQASRQRKFEATRPTCNTPESCERIWALARNWVVSNCAMKIQTIPHGLRYNLKDRNGIILLFLLKGNSPFLAILVNQVYVNLAWSLDMSAEHLTIAIKNLELIAVHLSMANAERYRDDDDFEGFEVFWKPPCLEAIREIKSENGIRKFQLALGSAVRLGPINSQQSTADDEKIADIITRFVLTYLEKEPNSVTEEGMRLFGEVNAVHNIWPYWRETVQTACGRMGFYGIASFSSDETQT